MIRPNKTRPKPDYCSIAVKTKLDLLFQPTTSFSFENEALEIFRYQANENPVYAAFCAALKVDPKLVTQLDEIPFLPVEFFKTQKICTGNCENALIFTSSGTTGASQSKHYVKDPEIYIASFINGFERVYGKPEELCILGLLPSYLEREGSSLIFMVQELIRRSKHPKSGFVLDDLRGLNNTLNELEEAGQSSLLIGVSYALLDLADLRSEKDLPLKHTRVMETGGMKGKRKELVKEELHSILGTAFGTPFVHSEYGMTELLSQAYSTGNGRFACPPWMRILIRDVNDPRSFVEPGKTGGINVIDLANIYSCSFIATQDLGRIDTNHQFEVLGRFDNSDIRGCNLLVD